MSTLFLVSSIGLVSIEDPPEKAVETDCLETAEEEVNSTSPGFCHIPSLKCLWRLRHQIGLKFIVTYSTPSFTLVHNNIITTKTTNMTYLNYYVFTLSNKLIGTTNNLHTAGKTQYRTTRRTHILLHILNILNYFLAARFYTCI
jgi:hypothetical protein